MATADEILATMAEEAAATEQTAEVCTIDRCTRAVTIPEPLRIVGVETDKDVTRRAFRVLCAYRGTDLSTFGVRINYMNANKEKDVYFVTDAQKDGDYLTFSWIISRKALKYKGKLQFVACLICDNGAENEREWNSTLGEFQVLEGLEVELTNEEEDQVRDVVDELLGLIYEQTDEAVKAIAAEGKRQLDALAELGEAGAYVQEAESRIAALEKDMREVKTVTDDIELLVPKFKNTATGETIALTDSAERPLQGLTLYGKTTQDGTPSPDAPVPMVDAGADGSIAVSIYGKNLLENNASSVTTSGVTFTVNADGSVTANGTATAMAALRMTGSYNGTDPVFRYKAGMKYIVSVSDVGKGVTFSVRSRQSGEWKALIETNTAGMFAPQEDGYATDIFVFVPSGTTVNSVTVYPMIRPDGTDAAFESYKDGGSMTALTPNGLPGIPVTSGGNYTDSTGQQWLCDEIDFGRGVYVQRIRKMVFDGSSDEVWSVNNGRAQTDLRDLQFPARIDVLPAMLCDHYENKTANQTYAGQIGVSMQGWSDGVTGAMFFRYADTADVSEWRTKLAASPVTCLTALQSPTETPLSESELTAFAAMKTQYPNTTISNDAGAGMKLDYIADTKNYIDQRIAALLTT